MAVERFNLLVQRGSRVNTGFVHTGGSPLFVQIDEFDETDNHEWGVVQWVSNDQFIDGETVVFDSKILFNNVSLFYPSIDFVPAATIWIYVTRTCPAVVARVKGWTFT